MDITVKNLQSSIPVPVSKIKITDSKVCRSLKLSHSFSEISITFVGTKRMRSVNKKYLGHDYVTDVITFDLEGTAEILICPQVARRNAKAHEAPLAQELLLYVVHGLLHLAGYDDHSPEDIKKIRLKEKQLLENLR